MLPIAIWLAAENGPGLGEGVGGTGGGGGEGWGKING